MQKLTANQTGFFLNGAPDLHLASSVPTGVSSSRGSRPPHSDPLSPEGGEGILWHFGRVFSSAPMATESKKKGSPGGGP